jgi:hypothetical protein
VAETWLKCSACKNPIPFNATHWVCSVSTCNRARTRLVFCTVSCWDSHVAMLRHRDAWAVEARAPTKEAWDKELAENPPEPAPAPKPAAAPAVRRVVDSPSAPMAVARPPVASSMAVAKPPVAPSSPAPAAAPGVVHLQEVVDRDILIVVSKVKKYIKDRSGMNCGDAVADVISEHVRAICDESIRAAARDERKTVLERDVPRPARR